MFQDISVIPILALFPLLALAPANDGVATSSLIAHLPTWVKAISIIIAVATVAVGGRYLTRPLFRAVASTGAREIFVATALHLVVAITLIMEMVGLSAALGTFLAGVVLADSEYRHELDMDLQPFKGLLLAIFFIAVGAGVEFNLIAKTPYLVIFGLLAFLAFKLLAQFMLAKSFGMQHADASRFAIAPTQGSEFGFVLVA